MATAVAATADVEDDNPEDPSSAPAFLDVATTSPSQVSSLLLAVPPIEREDAALKSLCDELGWWII